MLRFVLGRLLWMIPTTLGIALVVFGIYHLVPGDPASVMLGIGSGGELGVEVDVAQRVARFRREHGLDRHPLVQFLDYVGPVNLGPDGHAAFTHPRTEREVRAVEGEGGRTVREGKPLPIESLPGTDERTRERLEAARGVLLDEGAGASGWEAAAGELVAAGAQGLPDLLTALFDLAPAAEERAAAVARVASALERATGHRPEVDPGRARALGRGALIRQWFRWYYEEGGGDRVRNSGARPWGGLLCLELGREMQTRRPVAAELGKRLWVTIPLSLVSVLLSYLIAVPLGILSAQRQGTRLDGCLTGALFVLYSIPTFWAGLMLILVFGRTGLDLLPVLGLHDKDADTFSGLGYAWDTLLHAVLPVVTLTYGSLAYVSRQMRAGMLEVIRQDYIRTARAKGLPERLVIYKHALRNSLIPVLTLLASVLPVLIGGSVIVESVFDIPGMGRYAYEGLLRRDFSIVMATTICVGILTQVGMLLSDVAYSLADPRIRHG